MRFNAFSLLTSPQRWGFPVRVPNTNGSPVPAWWRFAWNKPRRRRTQMGSSSGTERFGRNQIRRCAETGRQSRNYRAFPGFSAHFPVSCTSQWPFPCRCGWRPTKSLDSWICKYLLVYCLSDLLGLPAYFSEGFYYCLPKKLIVPCFATFNLGLYWISVEDAKMFANSWFSLN